MNIWLILTTAFSFFLLMDSIGNVPLFTSLLKDFKPAKQRAIIIREMCIALGVILAFNFVGEKILGLLKIQMYTTMIGGGIVLFLISLKMIFPVQQEHLPAHAAHKEPYVVPLAIPLIAGPAVLAATIIYSHETSFWITIPAIVIAWFFSSFILLASSYLKNLLGWRGLASLERLMGLILTLISLEMFLEGLTLYISHNA